MIPQIYEQAEIALPTYSSTTYKLDLQNNHIAGKISGLEAIKQAAMKILLTERYGHLIYTAEYGVELETLIGKEFDLVTADIERRLNEALTVDDRIQSITIVSMDKTASDSLLLTVKVNSVEGAFILSEEVPL
jgi:phage baseplate assembly protein W